MLRTMLLCLLVSFSAPALALYKCKSGDSISYSDQPCPGAGEVLNTTPHAATDTAAARKRLAEEQKQVRQLENTRRRKEAQEEKERQRAEHEHAVKQKRCKLLAQRKKWAEEDLSTSSGRSTERARIKARRVAEQMELECGRVSLAG
jgi:hypothetical protein